MTLPAQRTQAVIHAREFLVHIMSPYGGYKRIPKEVRKAARRILKHFPELYDLGRSEQFDAETVASHYAQFDTGKHIGKEKCQK